MGFQRHVRFHSDSDRTADIAGGPVRAKSNRRASNDPCQPAGSISMRYPLSRASGAQNRKQYLLQPDWRAGKIEVIAIGVQDQRYQEKARVASLGEPVRPFCRDTGKVRKEPQVLLSRSELDGDLGWCFTDVGEKVRLSAWHDGALTRSDHLFLARYHDFDASRSHREMLVRARVDVHQGVAATGATLLKTHIEARACRIVDRSREDESFVVEGVAEL